MFLEDTEFYKQQHCVRRRQRVVRTFSCKAVKQVQHAASTWIFVNLKVTCWTFETGDCAGKTVMLLMGLIF